MYYLNVWYRMVSIQLMFLWNMLLGDGKWSIFLFRCFVVTSFPFVQWPLMAPFSNWRISMISTKSLKDVDILRVSCLLFFVLKQCMCVYIYPLCTGTVLVYWKCSIMLIFMFEIVYEIIGSGTSCVIIWSFFINLCKKYISQNMVVEQYHCM